MALGGVHAVPPPKAGSINIFPNYMGKSDHPTKLSGLCVTSQGQSGRHSSHTAALCGAGAQGPRAPSYAWLPPTLEIGPLGFLASTQQNCLQLQRHPTARPARVCAPAPGQGAHPPQSTAIPAPHPGKKMGLLTSAHIHQAESRDPSRSLGSLGAPRSGPARGKGGQVYHWAQGRRPRRTREPV